MAPADWTRSTGQESPAVVWMTEQKAQSGKDLRWSVLTRQETLAGNTPAGAHADGTGKPKGGSCLQARNAEQGSPEWLLLTEQKKLGGEPLRWFTLTGQSALSGTLQSGGQADWAGGAGRESLDATHGDRVDGSC